MRALRRFLPTLIAAAMVAAFAPVVASSAPDAIRKNDGHKAGEGRPGIEKTGHIRHVANIGDDIGWSGSDIEFASREVVKLSEGATGDPVCETDAATGECLVDENGEIVYQTERRDFAVAGGYGQPGRIIDITDPENPVFIGETGCNASQNDIQIHGDLLLVAQDGGTGRCTLPDGTVQTFNGSAVLDFSDPRNPVYLSRLQYSRGSHNHTFHPSGDYVYLSDSDVASTTGNVPVWDVSDPANPRLVTEFQHLVHSPHDITFNADGSRAYAAAVSATYILNTEDPENPELISTIFNEGISISHQSDPTPDGNFLLVADELGGGAAGVSPGGPVHVYDIRNEATPVKVGIIENNCVQELCHSAASVPVSTAHVFRINPDGYSMAIAWYKDGIFVVDYAGMTAANAGPSGETSGLGPRVIAGMRMPGANSWAAKMWQERHPGYVFVNDISRGFDVFHVPELDNGFIGTGAITGGHPVTGVVGGVTENEYVLGGCSERPVTQGLDSYVMALPEGSGDGTHTLTIEQRTGPEQVTDLDLWFFDEGCGLINTSVIESGGPIPEGAAHVSVAAFTGGAISFSAYVRS